MPTHASITDVACSCGYLERAAADPTIPITFDRLVNEYHIVGKCGEFDTAAPIYHCPFCGGVAPKSTRDELFASVSDSEAERIWALVGEAKTMGQIVEALGPPNLDDEIPITMGALARPPDKPNVVAERSICYTELSETANLAITVYSDETLDIAVVAKYRGTRESGA